MVAMTQTQIQERLSTNKAQLELLSKHDIPPILAAFGKSRNPSEACGQLKLPANKIHYRVKQLAEVGFLEPSGHYVMSSGNP